MGARFDLIINGGGLVDLAGALATARGVAPYLNAIESVNQAAIWLVSYGGLGGVDATVALQKDLCAAVKTDPALSKAAVYILTLGGVDPGAFVHRRPVGLHRLCQHPIRPAARAAALLHDPCSH